MKTPATSPNRIENSTGKYDSVITFVQVACAGLWGLAGFGAEGVGILGALGLIELSYMPAGSVGSVAFASQTVHPEACFLSVGIWKESGL